MINLNDYESSYFDYEHKNRNNDDLNLIKRMRNTYFRFPDLLIRNKRNNESFLDRFTDLPIIESVLE